MPSSRLVRKDGEWGGGGVALEVTVLSAESLRLPPTYSPLPRRLRPYVAVSSSSSSSSAGCSTGVARASSGAGEHSWEDARLVVPVGAGFLEGRDDVRVAVISESGCARLVGDTPLGWCRVPAADVLDGLRPPRSLRRLSYTLRCPRRGGPGHGVVHLAVRVLGDVHVARPDPAPPAQPGWCRVAMGIPVSGASAAAVVGTPSPWAWSQASR
ncbi:uncharacterized protein LOC123409799 [Hordeum vulgare subsp. vulgare]|uniref:Predicted protein n=1 Tax=Hordeum vulgare subsp. vulgare TaxID=112509 RepID=F2EHR1_HORVV|nr:uncharacterized protein LOC123409799 [Hordeum vulgare subsp. vulgare]BAK06883.1 predicted protein [Hordeum vulgare subsp. vulgare]